MRTIFLILLISVFGVFLRIADYSTVPAASENFDEVHFAWGGATWIRGGVPKSWSYLEAYKNSETINRFGKTWKIVWPVVEKPPLYFWLSGLVVVLFGPNNVFDVSHSVIRVLPLLLSFFSIFLTGFLALRVFGKRTGIVSALAYSTLPTIVLSNRLSVSEALLTPLMLLMGIIFTYSFKSKSNRMLGNLSVFLVALLSVLTKQVGLAVGVAAAVFYLRLSDFKKALFAVSGVVSGILIFALIGYLYDFNLYLKLVSDLRVFTLSGLPETLLDIFKYPGIGAKNRPFLDGTMLFGFILLFSAPFLFSKEIKDKGSKVFGFLILPLVFIVAVAWGQSGAGPFNYFATYIFPLFPFAVILLGCFMVEVYEERNFLPFLILFAVLGTSTLRFFFMNLPRAYQYLWQDTFVFFVVLSLVFYFVVRRYWQEFLLLLFAIFLAVNVYTVLNLKNTYESTVRNLNGITNQFGSP